MISRIKAWWHDPPHWRPLMLAAYCAALLWGVVGIANPGYAVTHYFGHALTIVWAALVSVGSLIAVTAVYTDRWWQERLGIKIAGLGLASDFLSVAVIFALHPEGRGLDMFVIAFAGILLWRRHQGISDWDYEPPEIDESEAVWSGCLPSRRSSPR